MQAYAHDHLLKSVLGFCNIEQQVLVVTRLLQLANVRPLPTREAIYLLSPPC